MAEPGTLASAVGRETASLLRDTYLPRLESALAELPAADLWWRPHERATSVGNLLLHLEGNLRQWILSGLGGEVDRRRRHMEFEARGGPGPAALLAALRDTVRAAATCIEALPAERWTDALVIQGMPTNVLAAVLHVVEHFAWHTGQITWIVKQRAGERHAIAFYDDARLDAARNEPRPDC
jgi:uncharacterized damage-inducible protein DinB